VVLANNLTLFVSGTFTSCGLYFVERVLVVPEIHGAILGAFSAHKERKIFNASMGPWMLRL
jgi:hypothetical protein